MRSPSSHQWPCCAGAVGEAPEAAAAGEILLRAEGRAVEGEVQRVALGQRLEGLGRHRLLGRGGRGERGRARQARGGACGQPSSGRRRRERPWRARGPVLTPAGSEGRTMDLFAEVKALVVRRDRPAGGRGAAAAGARPRRGHRRAAARPGARRHGDQRGDGAGAAGADGAARHRRGAGGEARGRRRGSSRPRWRGRGS